MSGGQLTLDLIASHNQSHPNSQVSPGDLKPVNDPDHICRGTLSQKNGALTCGCFKRADAPEPLTHKDVAGFDTLSNEVLRKLIMTRHMKSGFNNCKIQPLKIMFTDRPLELFVDPNIEHVAIHKAAVIPVHLKGIWTEM